MTKNKLNETLIKFWDEFNIWYEKLSIRKECSKCRSYNSKEPEWAEQVKKIDSLILKYFLNDKK